MKDPVKITCYGETMTMERADAVQFYLAAMAGSEGSERSTYDSIYMQLVTGEFDIRA